MDAHLNFEPSQTRFLELASLTHSPRDTHFPTILQPFLNLLASKSVRDFLFTRSSFHVQYLLSPSLPQRSILAATTNTTIDLHSPPPSVSQLSGESQHHAGYHLFVPVAVEDWITLGIGVYNGVSNLQTPFLPAIVQSRRMELNFRFVYDAQTRTALVLYEANQDGCYIVRTRRIKNTREDEQFTGIFPQEQLRNLALQKGSLNVSDLLQYLLLCEDGPFNTTCSICRRPSCNCSLPTPSKEPVGEFGMFIAAMANFISTKTTTAVRLNAMAHASRIVYQKAVIGIRTSLQGIIDANIREHLRSWSISDYTRSLKQNPMASQQFFLNSWPHAEEDYATSSSTIDAVDWALLSNERKDDQGENNQSPTPSPQLDLDPGFGYSTNDSNRQLPQQLPSSAQNLIWSVDGKNPNQHSPLSPTQRSIRPNRDRMEKTEEQKEAERRERNRAAARRSAMRERAAFENLKSEVRNNHDAIKVLKARERSLRDENLKLRDQLLQKLDVERSR